MPDITWNPADTRLSSIEQLLRSAGLWNDSMSGNSSLNGRVSDSGTTDQTLSAMFPGYSWGTSQDGNTVSQFLGDASGNMVGQNQEQDLGAWNTQDTLRGLAAVGGGYLGANALFGGLGAAAAAAPEATSYLGGITGTGPGTGMLGATGGGAAGSAAGGLGGGVSSMGAGMGGVTDFLGGISPNTWAQLGSAGIGLISNNRALNAGADANAQSNALLRYMYDTNRADNQPLVDLRNSVLPRINGLLSNPSSITSDPGYQFGLQQGATALNNSAAARGMTYSGAQGKALQRYGQDYAGSKLDQSLNRLTGVAGLGQVGSNNNQQATTQYGTTAANNALGMGNFRGSAYQQQGNILGNALSGAFNSWQNGDILKNLLGGG